MKKNTDKVLQRACCPSCMQDNLLFVSCGTVNCDFGILNTEELTGGMIVGKSRTGGKLHKIIANAMQPIGNQSENSRSNNAG